MLETSLVLRAFSAVLIVVAVCAALGCQDEQIRKYSVTKLDPQPPASPLVANTKTAEPGEISRMVAAIAERPEAAWIYKITGTKTNVDGTEIQWRTFLEQIAFDETNNAKWQLPDGWKESPGDAFRFATLSIASVQPPVEIAVSRLPAGQDLSTNVNRWRGQLGLSPVSASAVESSLKKISVGELTLLLFDETGELSAAMLGMGPAPVPSKAKENAPVPETSTLPFDFTPPADWERGPTTQFTAHRFLRKVGDRSVQLAMTRLPPAAQSWTDNVNMWCSELELSALSVEDIEKLTTDVTVDGREAKSILLKSVAENGRASQVVRLTTDTDSWFFKLTGDATLVAESQTTFDQFIQSIRFKAP